jgi:hypothetical protein
VPDDAVKPTDRGRTHLWVEALAALDVEALAAEAGMFREQLPLAEGIAAKLSRLLLGFLQVEVLPQMPRPGSYAVIPSRCELVSRTRTARRVAPQPRPR